MVETVAVASTAVSFHLLCRADKPNAAAHMSKRPAPDFPRNKLAKLGKCDRYIELMGRIGSLGLPEQPELVSHHFHISNLGISNNPRIMSDPIIGKRVTSAMTMSMTKTNKNTKTKG